MNATDALVSICLDEGKRFKAIELAKQGASPSVIERVTTCCIKNLMLTPAIELAGLIPRELTQKELCDFVVISVNRGLKKQHDYDFYMAIEAAKMGVPDESIEIIVSGCVQCGFDRHAQQAVELLEREFTKDEIENMVHSSLEKNWTSMAISAAKKGASIPVIEKVIAKSVSSGSLYEANKAAELIPRELSVNEFETIIASRVMRGTWADLTITIEAGLGAGRSLTQEEAKPMIRDLIKMDRFDLFLGEIKILQKQSTPEMAHVLIETCCGLGRPYWAESVANYANHQFTKEERDMVALSYIKQKDSRGAQNLIKSGVVSRETVNSYIRSYIDNGWFIAHDDLSKLTEVSPSPEVVKEYISHNIASGCSVEFLEVTASILGYELSEEEREAYIATCVSQGYLENAQKAVEAIKAINRDLTIGEIDQIVLYLLDPEKRRQGLHWSDVRDRAIKAAKLGASCEVIKKLILKLVETDRLDEAKELSSYLESG